MVRGGEDSANRIAQCFDAGAVERTRICRERSPETLFVSGAVQICTAVRIAPILTARHPMSVVRQYLSASPGSPPVTNVTVLLQKRLRRLIPTEVAPRIRRTLLTRFSIFDLQIENDLRGGIAAVCTNGEV